jgi:hypothetical protein
MPLYSNSIHSFVDAATVRYAELGSREVNVDLGSVPADREIDRASHDPTGTFPSDENTGVLVTALGPSVHALASGPSVAALASTLNAGAITAPEQTRSR